MRYIKNKGRDFGIHELIDAIETIGKDRGFRKDTNDSILAQRVLVAAILRKLFEYRKIGDIREFIVIIDEAHRYAPSGSETVSKNVKRC